MCIYPLAHDWDIVPGRPQNLLDSTGENPIKLRIGYVSLWFVMLGYACAFDYDVQSTLENQIFKGEPAHVGIQGHIPLHESAYSVHVLNFLLNTEAFLCIHVVQHHTGLFGTKLLAEVGARAGPCSDNYSPSFNSPLSPPLAIRTGACKLQCRVKQNLAAGGKVLRCRTLDLVVTNAIFTGHEDHGRGHYTGQIARIVARSTNEIHMRYLAASGRPAHRSNAFMVKRGGLKMPDLFNLQLEAESIGSRLTFFLELDIHLGEIFFLWMP